MLPVRNAMNLPVQRVKDSCVKRDSPVQHLNECPAKKSKRSNYVATPVIHQMSFVALQDWILSHERKQAQLHPSKGTNQTLLDSHYSTIPENDENNFPSEETLVSHDLSTSLAFSDRREPSTFEVMESTLPSEKTLVSQGISASEIETFSNSTDVLAQSPVQHLNKSPAEKNKRSHYVPASVIHQMNLASVEDWQRHNSVKKVKDSPVENLNKSPAEKNKRSDYVPLSVIHQMNFSSLQHWISEYERKQAQLHHSEGTDQTLLDSHYNTIPEKDENNLPFEETLVPHDLSTSLAFSDRCEPSTFEVMESNLPSEKPLVSQGISTLEIETFSDTTDVLAQSPVQHLYESPAKKCNRSHYVAAPVIHQTSFASVEDWQRHNPVIKVKDSPVKNLNESPAKRSKRSHYVAAPVIHQMSFAPVEDWQRHNPVKTVKDSPVENHLNKSPVENHLNKSPVEKYKRSHYVPVSVIHQMNLAPVKGWERLQPVKKVKDSPVKNLNESPAEKNKRSHYVPAPVIHQMSFASVEDWILSYEKTQAPLHRSEGKDQTLLDSQYSTIPEKDENNLPFEETLLSHDLSTSGAFSDWREPSTFEVMESTLPSEETLVSQDTSVSEIETFSDSIDLLVQMRQLTLCSGGEVTYSEPVEKSNFFDGPPLLICFCCQRNSFVNPPITKHKLVCKKHGDGGSCPFTEKFQETAPAQPSKTLYQYLNYNCFMCDCTSCDLRTFNYDLKCGLCLKMVTLCEKCSLSFSRYF